LCRAGSNNLVVKPTLSSFFSSNIFCSTMHTKLGLSHSFGLQVVTLHVWPTSRPCGDSPSVRFMVRRRRHPLHPSWEMLIRMLCASKLTFFHLPPSIPIANKLTLCFRLMAFTHWPMSSLLIPLELTWVHTLHCFGSDCDNGNKRRISLKLVPCKLIYVFGHWGIWVFTPTSKQLFSSMC
jgi:hypothetical protein